MHKVEERRQAMPSPALEGFLSNLLLSTQAPFHIVVDNAKSGETAEGWQQQQLQQQQHSGEKALKSRWSSDACNNSPEQSTLAISRRNSPPGSTESGSSSEEAVYLKLQKLQHQNQVLRRCHSANAADLFPVSVLRVARPALQIKEEVSSSSAAGDLLTSRDQHDTDDHDPGEASTEEESELEDYYSERSGAVLLMDVPAGIAGLVGSSSASSSKADIALGNLLIQTIEKLSIKAALALSRPHPYPAAAVSSRETTNTKVSHETMEILPSRVVAATDVKTTKRSANKRTMINQGEEDTMIHPPSRTVSS
jgi:hypothetical protein